MDSQPNISRFAACLQVFRLTLRRQFFSRQTIVIGVLLFLALAITIVWAVPKPWSPGARTGEQLAEQILSPLFMGFLLPLISLGYASSTISGAHRPNAGILAEYQHPAAADLPVTICGGVAADVGDYAWLPEFAVRSRWHGWRGRAA